MSLKKQLYELNRGADNLESSTAPINDMDKSLERIQNLEKQMPKILKLACLRLTSYVRKALSESFSASGVGTKTPASEYKHTGLLRQAAVAGATVTITSKGIRIGMGAGYDKKVYQRAGALNYGSVRNTSSKGKAKSKLKKTLASVAASTGQTSFGKTVYIAASKFFYLSTSQVADLNSQFNAIVQELISNYLESGK